jgi:protein TonB
MFDETLLDSSPARAPVLKSAHWIISVVVGALGLALWYFGIPLILGPAASSKILLTQSVLFGGLPFFFYALMICYVFADTRHLGFNTLFWVAVVVVLNLVGYILYLIYSAKRIGDWKRATLPIAYIFEVILIGGMILYPLIYTNALPKGQLMTFLVAPPPPPPPPPPAAAPPKIVVHQVSLQQLLKAPTVIPKTIQIVKDQPRPQGAVGVVGGVPGGVPGGQAGGVMGGILGGLGTAPPPPPPKPQTPSRIRVGGQVEAAKQIYAPAPEYPPLAKMARIQGTVRLQAIIAKDGTIKDLTVLSGHPLLAPAALAAVRQWRYQPTLLNGEPVEVETEIDVIFTLAD